MKVINKKIFEVAYIIPETPVDYNEIKKIIREVSDDKVHPSEWKPVDNRPIKHSK
jgi:hypothetical protein